MNSEEIYLLLGYVKAFDNRELSEAAAAAWEDVLGGRLYADARRAVAEHFEHSDAYLMPVHIGRLCDGYEKERREDAEFERSRHEIETQHRSTPLTTDPEARAEFMDRIRRLANLPAGRPDKLRGPHWLATHPDERNR